MDQKKLIAICQSGGEFNTDKDGVMSYYGGEAHAIDIDGEVFKMEVAEMFGWNIETLSIKYFLPGNRKTLITISNDKDLMRMIKFHHNCGTVDIYVMLEEILASEISSMPVSRSSRTSLSEAVMAVDALIDMVDDKPLDDFVDPLDSQMDIPLDDKPEIT